MRYKQPGESKRYKSFGYPIIPLFYIALCVTIEIILLKYKPEFTWRGLYIVIAGIPVYYGWKYRAKIAEVFRK